MEKEEEEKKKKKKKKTAHNTHNTIKWNVKDEMYGGEAKKTKRKKKKTIRSMNKVRTAQLTSA